MELYSKNFRKEVILCLETKRVIGTIQMKHHGFLNLVRAREDVSLFTLTEMNRDYILAQIVNLMT